MTRSVLLALVLLVAVLVSAVAQSPGPGTVNERRSGTPFPVSLTPPGGTTPHWITGTAIRQRTIFRVKIYAFASWNWGTIQMCLTRFTRSRRVVR